MARSLIVEYRLNHNSFGQQPWLTLKQHSNCCSEVRHAGDVVHSTSNSYVGSRYLSFSAAQGLAWFAYGHGLSLHRYSAI